MSKAKEPIPRWVWYDGVKFCGQIIHPGTYATYREFSDRWYLRSSEFPTSYEDAMKQSNGVHECHCCVLHGCKYGEVNCPVVNKTSKQEYICELCEEDGIQDLNDISFHEKANELKIIALQVGLVQLEASEDCPENILMRSYLKGLIKNAQS